MSKFIFALVFLVGAPHLAHAFPLPGSQLTPLKMPATFTADYNFEGIVALNNCSGSLVRFETSKDSDRAMVMTNGHCLESGFAKPGGYTYGKQSSRSFYLLDAGGDEVGTVRATEIIYSTMTSTDLTLYKVKETFAEIEKKYGIHPMTLSSQHPELSEEIEIISGYWVRGYSCGIEAFAYQLREDDYTCSDSMRYSRPGCEVIPGTSGSPAVLKGTRTVVGINNTGNMDGEECTMNNPCEVDQQGNISYKKGYSYAQQTYWIYTCLDKNNEVDLSVQGCLLPH